jgi:hypothetical protein
VYCKQKVNLLDFPQQIWQFFGYEYLGFIILQFTLGNIYICNKYLIIKKLTLFNELKTRNHNGLNLQKLRCESILMVKVDSAGKDHYNPGTNVERQ